MQTCYFTCKPKTRNVLRIKDFLKYNRIIPSFRYCDEKKPENSKKKTKNKEKKDLNLKETLAVKEVTLLKKENLEKSMAELLINLNKNKFTDKEQVDRYQHQLSTTKIYEISQGIFKKKEYADIDAVTKEAVKKVCLSVNGDPKKTETELMRYLKSHSETQPELGDIISEMKFEKTSEDKYDRFKGQQQGRRLPRSKFHSETNLPIDLYGHKPLGIFTKAKEETLSSEQPSQQESFLPTYDAAVARDLRLAITSHPKNYFEEIIKWTEQGIFWKFPIDNESGLEEEKSFGFADHIFLERHLNGWCPKTGPIRHFMELIVIGLSKNPYLTVARKKAHIEWYRNYFDQKKEILEKTGTI